MIVGPLADWLGRHLPAAYGLAHPPWLALMRLLHRMGYWEGRRHFRYYEEVVRLAAWTRRAPVAVSVVTDARERLIAVYRGDASPCAGFE